MMMTMVMMRIGMMIGIGIFRPVDYGNNDKKIISMMKTKIINDDHYDYEVVKR